MDEQTPLILASASPRRHDLLGSLGLDFAVLATDGEERRDAVPPEILGALPPFPLARESHPSLLAWRYAGGFAPVIELPERRRFAVSSRPR